MNITKDVLSIYFLILVVFSSFSQPNHKYNLKWAMPNLKGHWKLIDTKIVDRVRFLNPHAPASDPMKMTSEDSPWDNYTKYDLVFENDSMFQVHYPIQAFESVRFFLDTGYLHITNKDNFSAYPIQLINDTLTLYKPLSGEPGYFKELYVRTSFNDSILNVMKKYGINYPELAGTWLLVREEDFDYGTHYELRFPHAIPDSIKFSRKQMITALEHQKIYMLSTDGIKRDYSFWYDKSCIYIKPGKWYKGKHDPMIHFYKK